jgi:hypothetical protein
MSDETRDSIDAHLTRAFRKVPVPDGLAERLLAGLTPVVPRRSRRWLLAGAAVLTTAATLLIAVWLNQPRPEGLSGDTLCSAAIQAFDSMFAKTGQSLVARPAPSAFPLSQWVCQFRQTAWQTVDDFMGSRALVYQLPGRDGVRAALYVTKLDTLAGLDSAPTVRPTFTTAGWCASAWAEDGCVYVLVVQGDESDYRDYLNLPRSPVA